MAAQRCTDCGISYPITVSRCLGCGHRNDIVGNIKPDLDWKESSDSIREKLAEADAEVSSIIQVKGRVTFRDENFFISSWDVVSSGRQNQLLPDTLIQVGRQLFEVGGYSESRREYWLILFDPSLEETHGP